MDDPGPASIWPQLLLVFVLTMINAFFAAAEMAVVSVSKSKIRAMAEDGNKRAKRLQTLLEDPTKFLSTIQVAITLAGFFSSASAATGMSDDFGRFLEGFGIPYGTEIAIVLITLILSYVTLVLGELVPKRIALQRAEGVALFAAPVIQACKTVATPFVKLLSVSTNGVLRLFGIRSDGMEEQVSEDEIRMLVAEGGETGAIKETEREMIDGVFELDDLIVEEVMTPRTDVYCINIDQPLEEYLDDMLQQRYSRIPVYQGDVDHIIGVLHIRDFVRAARECGFEQVDVRVLLRQPFLLPERQKVSEAFAKMQGSHTHLAVLIDEYGGFSGIVTMEDLIEEIVGDIGDEFDPKEPDIRAVDANTYLVRGGTSIIEINEELGLSLDEETEDYDTIGGLVIYLLGYIPPDGYTGTVEYESLSLKIERVQDNRIELVKLYIPPSAEKTEEN